MSDDMLTIYIPTYRRVDNQVTWHNLSKKWQARTFLVARPDEVGPLRDKGYNVLECPARGISPTRGWILDQHDIDLLGPKVAMMDDDLAFYVRRQDDPTKFRQMREPEKDFDAMMERVLHMMDFVAIGGISNRSGANRDIEPWRRTARLHDVLVMDMEVVRKEGFRIDIAEFMEDFDFVLQFLSAGYPMLCLNTHCKGDRGSNVDGGCSEYRTHEGQERAAKYLAERWPAWVTTTERPGWNGAMSGTRTDVRVAWKRALEDGIAARELLGREPEREFTWDASGTLRYV